MKKLTTLAGVLGLACLSPGADAADHIDSPAAVAEPTADLTDLFAWTSADGEKLNITLTVHPFATAESAFSPAVQYAFHVNSSEGYGMAQTETLVLCQFYDVDRIECWAGDEYVEGSPSDEAGIASESGMLKVFAGPRNDPFFMEFSGFTEAVKTVIGAAGSLSFDDDSCPMLDSETSGALVSQLQSGAEGEAASDTFAGANVLALVVQIDKSLVNSGGPLLGVWASTHASN